MQFTDSVFFGNSVRTWLLAGATAFAIAGGLSLLKLLLFRRARQMADRTDNEYDDIVVSILASTKFLFLLFLGIWLGARSLVLPPTVDFVIRLAAIVAAILQVAAWANVALKAVLERRMRQTLEQDPAAATTIAALGFLLRIALWSVLILVGLTNLGVDIGPLLAGLGVGGVAVALALQNILGDLFASLSIVLDKPFVIGDFIVVDNVMGNVEYIGLKTTRVRSLSGEQIVLSNSDLLRSRVRNMKRMHQRRVVFDLAVAFATPNDKLERVPVVIREIITARPDLRFERSHLRDFLNYACNFETVYWVNTADYNVFVANQQAINLELRSRLEEEGIEIARPVQFLVENRSDPV